MFTKQDKVLSDKDIDDIFCLYRHTENWFVDDEGRERERHHASTIGHVLISDFRIDELSSVVDHLTYVLERETGKSIELYYPRILKYGFRCYLGEHTDGNEYGFDTDTDHSLIVGLCDQAQYKGGQLIFNKTDQVKLNAGDIVFFDYNTVHEVKAVSNGIRYTLNFRATVK